MTAKRKAEPSETAPQPHQRVHEPLQAFEQHQNELLTSISAKLEEICAQQTEKTVRRLKTTQTKALASLSQKLDTLKVFATNLEELKAQIETTQSEYRTALAALQAELNSVKKNTSDQLRAILNEVRRGRSELAGRIFEPRPSYMEGINRVPRETKIIASLTSYSKRIDFVAPCAYSLLHQTMKPDMVVLWLAESDFPHRTADLPRELVRLQELGLSIEWCEELRPHKKYYEAMKRWPDDIIITFDDDVIYPAQIVESLFKAWQKHPDSVCTTRARRICTDEDGQLLPYNDWTLYEGSGAKGPSLNLLPTGVGGVLYPPRCMDEELFNKTEIKKLCLFNDDLWLKFMQLKKGTPVFKIDWLYPWITYVEGSQENSLWHINQGKNQNDLCLAKMKKYFSRTSPDLADIWSKAAAD